MPNNESAEIQDKADVLILSLKKGTARFSLPSKLSAYLFQQNRLSHALMKKVILQMLLNKLIAVGLLHLKIKLP